MEFMNQQLVQLIQEVKQLKASQILRQTTVQQCRNAYSSMDGKFCAMGAIMNYFGWNGYGSSGFDSVNFQNLGINNDQWAHVMNLNDVQDKSFAEIADWLEMMGL